MLGLLVATFVGILAAPVWLVVVAAYGAAVLTLAASTVFAR